MHRFCNVGERGVEILFGRNSKLSDVKSSKVIRVLYGLTLKPPLVLVPTHGPPLVFILVSAHISN